MASRKKKGRRKKTSAPSHQPKSDPPKNRGGRPPKYQDKEVRYLVLRGLKAGWTFEEVAKLAGISDDTLRNWRDMDAPAAADDEVKKFFGTLKRAQLLGELELVERCQEGVNGWQGAAWCLERRRRDKYRKPDNKPVTESIPVRIEVVDPYKPAPGDDADNGADTA